MADCKLSSDLVANTSDLDGQKELESRAVSP